MDSLTESSFLLRIVPATAKNAYDAEETANHSLLGAQEQPPMKTDQPVRADRAGLRELYALVQAALSGSLDALTDSAAWARSGSAGRVRSTARPAGPSGSPPDWFLQSSQSRTAKTTRSGGAHLATMPRSGTDPSTDDPDDSHTTRIVALVELAKKGDAEAFGQLYDTYVSTIYRYIYYRVGGHALAEDLTSETFLRALRSLTSFRWQGRDFGAWLVTIARNLVADHFKSGRFRLEVATGEILDYDSVSEGPEDDVLASLTNEALVQALKKLGADQQECLVLRFLTALSVTETARVLGKSDGAVKQLQLRAVRNLAKLLPEGLR